MTRRRTRALHPSSAAKVLVAFLGTCATGAACSSSPSIGHGGAGTTSSSSGTTGATTTTSSAGGGGGASTSTGPGGAGATTSSGTAGGSTTGGAGGAGATTTTTGIGGGLVCLPGSAMCAGTATSMVCSNDGSGYVAVPCDPVMGLTCDPTSGMCAGACASSGLGKTYIGCDYYPTVLANGVSETFHYAVAVANQTMTAANVTVTQGPAMVTTAAVPAGGVTVIDLPWVEALKQGNPALVPAGAYRLRSDQPVTVYQFNPLEYELDGNYSYTNDASLLLPVNAWGTTYYVVTYEQSTNSNGDSYAVVASQDGTTVTVTTPPGADSNDLPAAPIMLDQGDVLQVSGPDPVPTTPQGQSGTMIVTDKPVQVFGGNVVTSVGSCCADHLEEAMPPLEALGLKYLVTPPALTNGGPGVNEIVRIVATAANTTLTYDPPQPTAPTTIAQAGGYVDIIDISADFQVTASAKILVGQLMESEDSVGGGDPSLSLAIPTGQYRTSYLFYAPLSYDTNFVNIAAPTGAMVLLDGAAVTGFTAVGGTGYSVARIELSNAGNGNHTVTSAKPVGISVYGYGMFTSYWYPGGQDFRAL